MIGSGAASVVTRELRFSTEHVVRDENGVLCGRIQVNRSTGLIDATFVGKAPYSSGVIDVLIVDMDFDAVGAAVEEVVARSNRSLFG